MFKRMLQEELGQDLAEYALIICAMVLAVASTVSSVSNELSHVYSNIIAGLGQVTWESTVR